MPGVLSSASRSRGSANFASSTTSIAVHLSIAATRAPPSSPSEATADHEGPGGCSASNWSFSWNAASPSGAAANAARTGEGDEVNTTEPAAPPAREAVVVTPAKTASSPAAAPAKKQLTCGNYPYEYIMEGSTPDAMLLTTRFGHRVYNLTCSKTAQHISFIPCVR